MANRRQVLVVGAGPTGLVCALWLARGGADVRIVDKAAGPGLASRAMVLHARTLEFYEQLGFAAGVIERGMKVERLHLREGGEEAAVFEFGDMGEGASPYPFMLSFPQDEHERFLGERLAEAGLAVEWGTELVGFEDDGSVVRATLRRDGADETCEAEYLCGCDGARSAVRRILGFDFPGGTYDQLFYVADVEAEGEVASNRDFNMCVAENTFAAVFPVRRPGMNRLIGIVAGALADKPDITFEDVRPAVEQTVGVRVTAVNWFSTYHVHHRVAESFRRGRVFIAGDAGHVHSPAGGQGMNTGIGDAVNMAWKLGAVVGGRADASILDTYEPERIAFARLLVSTTDRAFTAFTGRGVGNKLFRSIFVAHVAPFALGFARVRKAAFRTVSQTRINYHGSALAEGEAGEVRGGDRMPWVGGVGKSAGNGGETGNGVSALAGTPPATAAAGSNFAPLRSLDWHAYVYGTASGALRDATARRGLPLEEMAWNDAVEEAGFAKDALYLVRPDGYVALASAPQDVGALEAFMDRFRIVPAGAPA